MRPRIAREGGLLVRLTAIVLLAVLAAGSGGCIVQPTFPTVAAGYGHTYEVADEDGHPLNDGFLVLRSDYGQITPPPDMYNCYDVKDGRAEVPFKVAVRMDAGCWYFCWVTWANPSVTTIWPFVPGYVPEGPQGDWSKRFQVGGLCPPAWVGLFWEHGETWAQWRQMLGKGPPAIRLIKADRQTEIDYLDYMSHWGWLRQPDDVTQRASSLYAEEDLRADLAARRRAAEYVAARLKELGDKP
jgi:hypothetical protein